MDTNSTTAVSGKAELTLASVATAVVEFMTKCPNYVRPTVTSSFEKKNLGELLVNAIFITKYVFSKMRIF